jgi:pimeloyl-ACP methyl ester carboxylesterase
MPRTPVADESAREQTRARYPDADGYVERDGVRLFYERYGRGEPTLLFLPSWSIVHSRIWKAQVPYFARLARVVTFDPPGNGRSDRPLDPAAHSPRSLAADALAVLDATETERAVVVSLSAGADTGLVLAAEHPGRVEGAVFIAPALALAPGHAERVPLLARFDEELDSDEGWATYNRHYWLRDYRGFLEFFFSQCLTEAHSTKQTEDAVGWGLDSTAESLLLTQEDAAEGLDEVGTRELCARVERPVLVIHGDHDAISPHARGAELARLTGARMLTVVGGGHFPHARDPVQVNLAIRDFALPPPAVHKWPRGRARRKRALYVSSPIGLGHARRDIAIATELRELVPDLEIDWLAQHPVTAALEARGERIHPASRDLANESAHIARESDGHRLHCFRAWRRMDEILLANFMLFDEVTRSERYDLWIGDEAWELDYYLHENPELKRAAYVWLTDFVGWLPMPGGGEREALVTADYNAEMIEHIARFPRVRDRALFVGSPDDIVLDRFGPGLPPIREWTEAHYTFCGYVSGFDAAALADRAALRDELGFAPDEQVCVVTVGGSGVGQRLLHRVIEALPEARARVPGLRIIAVAGPRIDPASLAAADGLEVRRFVPDLQRYLAACDLAVVQGGLTTTMELTALRRPFLYAPLRDHFEQQRHVRHRLERYRAGRCIDLDSLTPVGLAEAIAGEIGRAVDYRPVEEGGAAVAAARIAELL